MEVAFLAIYIAVSLFLYVIMDFRLKRFEMESHNNCCDRFNRAESGIRRLEEDYQKVIVRLEAEKDILKSKISSTDK